MTQIIVRGYHLDGYQHVNNARYLEFLEEARWDCMSDDIDYFTQKKIAWVIVNVNINYRQPALLGQHLVIDTQISKIGSKSGVVNQVIRCRETSNVIVDALVTFVLFDMKQNMVLPLEGQLREKLVSSQDKLAALSKV